MSFPPRIKYGVNSSGNPDVVPAEAGIYNKELGSCFHRKPWIPDHVRNDKTCKVITETVHYVSNF